MFYETEDGANFQLASSRHLTKLSLPLTNIHTVQLWTQASRHASQTREFTLFILVRWTVYQMYYPLMRSIGYCDVGNICAEQSGF